MDIDLMLITNINSEFTIEQENLDALMMVMGFDV
jgi:hypothetical protein